jgi:hypothetical protein
MTKRRPSTIDALFQGGLHPAAKLFRFDQLADGTNCSQEEKMNHVFLRIAASSPHISNKRREPRVPRCCADQGGCAAPLHAALGHGSTRAGSVRATQRESMLHLAVAAGARFPGSAYFLRKARDRAARIEFGERLLAQTAGTPEENRGEVWLTVWRIEDSPFQDHPESKTEGERLRIRETLPNNTRLIRRAKSGRPCFR